MADLAQIGFQVDTSDLRQASQQLAALGSSASAAEGKTRGFAQGFDSVNQSVGSTVSVFELLKTTLEGIGLYLTGRQVLEYAETYSKLTDHLSIAIDSVKELSFYQDQLFKTAQESHSSLESTYSIFERLSKVKDKIGISNEDILRLTDIINKTAQLSGQDPFSTDQSIRQLTQALAEDDLKGLQLTAVLRGNQRLAQAIGEGLGYSIGEVRRLGDQGKLTFDTVVQAILSQGSRVDREFGKLSVGPSAAWVDLKNSITRYIGEADKSLGVTKSIADEMEYLSGHLQIVEGVATTLAILALPKLVAGLASVVGALTGLSTANPFTLIGTGLAIATGYLVAHREEIKPLKDSYATLGDFAVAVWNDIAGASDNSATESKKAQKNSLTEILSDVKSFANAFIGSFELASKFIGTIFATLGTFIVESLTSTVDAAKKAWDAIKNGTFDFTPAKQALQHGFVDPFTNAIAQVQNDIAKVSKTDYIGTAFDNAVTAIQNFLKKYQRAAEQIHDTNNKLKDEARLQPLDFAARFTTPLPSSDFTFTKADLDKQLEEFTKLRAAADQSTDAYQRLTASIKAYQTIKDKNLGLKPGEFDQLVAEQEKILYLEEKSQKALQHTDAYEHLQKQAQAAVDENKKLIDSLNGGVDAYERTKMAVEAENQVIQTGLDLGDKRAKQLQTEIELNLRRKDSIEKIAQVQGQVADTIQSSFESAIIEGKSLDEVLQSLLKDLAKIAFQEATRGLFRSIVGGVFSIFSGGAGAGVASAKGNVFSGGNLYPFASGGVVNSPMIFPMANGGTGLAGEAGPEAILPLRRTASGDLGVVASGSGGGGVGVVNQTVNITVQGGATGNPQQDDAFAKRIALHAKDALRSEFNENLRNAARPGNFLNPAYGLRA